MSPRKQRALLQKHRELLKASKPPAKPLGSNLVNNFVKAVAPVVRPIQQFQSKFREATDKIPGVKQAEALVNKAVEADDMLPSSRAAQGSAIVAEQVGRYLNIDPRIVMAAPFLVGAVHTSGPRAGTTKLKTRRDIPVPHDQLEDALEAAYQHHKKTGTLKGYNKHVANLPDNQQAVIFNRGNIDFDTRNGLTLKIKEGQVTTTKPSPKPSPKPEPVQPPKPSASGTPKHYNQQPSTLTLTRDEKSRLLIPDDALRKQREGEFYSNKAVTDRKGVKYSLPKGNNYARPLSDKPVKITYPDGTTKEHIIRGSKSIQEDIRKIPGYEDVVIDSVQAHHKNVLKASTDYAAYYDNPKIVTDAYDKYGIPYGDDVFNRVDLPVRLHQTDPGVKVNGEPYTGYNSKAAHERLQARPGTPEGIAGTPIQAEPKMTLWGHLKDMPNDAARATTIEEHIAQIERSMKIANEAYMEQFYINKRPNNEAFVDPYIGNFAQQVLAPHDAIGDIIRQAYINNRKQLMVK